MEADAVSADGTSVRYEVHGGHVPALVFVHGWSCDRRYWDAQMGHFAGRHRVVAIDLAGHGQSSLGRKAWTMARFGEDVVAVVDQLGLAEMVLVGHSMGGDVIVEAALRLPGRVTGLVWVDTYRTLGRTEPDDAAEEFVTPFRIDFVTTTRNFVTRLFLPDSATDLVEWVASDMSNAPPEVAIDAMKHAITNEPAVVAGLREITAPVVAINPDHLPTDVDALERHGVRAMLMSGGHFLMMEEPDSFNRLLTQAVEQFGASRNPRHSRA
jgi:pimeloyl-ACP methyl ester carboxylesterase